MTPLATLLWLFVTVVAAQTPPAIPCGGLPGCGDGGAANILVDAFLPGIGTILLRLAGALAVLFVVIAGYQIFTAQGDDGKYGAGKTAIVYALGGLVIAGLSQTIIGLVVSDPNLAVAQNEVSAVAVVVNALVTLMNGIFFVVIAYAAIQMLVAQGRQEKYEQARSIITQAIVGAIVVNLANALVQIITSFLGI